jgi:hypothetical protein
MDTNKSKAGFFFIISVILAGALFRFIPHWPNFTPIAAMALFGGAYLGRRHLAFAIPFAAMFLSDLLLGMHKDMWAVYLAFGITVFIGTMIRNKVRFISVVTASLVSSIIFFLLTNFAAWLASPIYPETFGGLMQSYIAGLAFFNNGSLGISFFMNEITGALFYNGLFFGVYAFALQRFPKLSQVS